MASEGPTPETWTIDFAPEARRWLNGLSGRDRERIAAAFDKLEELGPALPRPASDLVRGSRHHNMKELRSFGGNLRALYTFDPHRRAIVLLGGDKTNDWKGWYARNIPRADKLYDRHLRSLGKEGAWAKRAPRAGARSASAGR